MSGQSAAGPVELVVRSQRLEWPDTFTEDAAGNIYISISRIDQSPMVNNGYSQRHGQPFEVFRIQNSERE